MEEKFYTCKKDRAFKEVFMKEENKELLIALLESVLDIKIKELKYLNLEKNTDNINIRSKRFDLHVKTNSENIQIEVNSQMHDYIRPRNASFLFDTYSHKVGVGEKYDEKTLFVQINFTYGLGSDSKYFNKEEDENINVFMLRNNKGKPFIDNLKLIEFNMDYFTKLWYSNDEKLVDKYKYIIMMNLGKKDLEKLSKKDKVVERYMSEIERVNEDPDFREYISAEEDARKIENSLRDEYREEGLAEGRTKGLAEGRAEGRAEGIKEGIKETARKMKDDGLSFEVISRYTNLTVEEIEKM